jgi:hypothetical protein
MYQPSHITTEIGRMRAEEMRARAERYRTIQKAKQHKKTEPEEENAPSRSRIFVYRKALGIVGLSVLMVLVFAGAALAMPADAPSGVGGDGEAFVSQPQVREGPPSYWATIGGQERAAIQHLGESEFAGVFGGQERAAIQHLGESEFAGVFGGQERAAIQHVAEAPPQPSTNLDPSSGGIDLEIVLLTGTLALVVVLMAAGALVWFRRHTVKPA